MMFSKNQLLALLTSSVMCLCSVYFPPLYFWLILLTLFKLLKVGKFSLKLLYLKDFDLFNKHFLRSCESIYQALFWVLKLRGQVRQVARRVVDIEAALLRVIRRLIM